MMPSIFIYVGAKYVLISVMVVAKKRSGILDMVNYGVRWGGERFLKIAWHKLRLAIHDAKSASCLLSHAVVGNGERFHQRVPFLFIKAWQGNFCGAISQHR